MKLVKPPVCEPSSNYYDAMIVDVAGYICAYRRKNTFTFVEDMCNLYFYLTCAME